MRVIVRDENENGYWLHPWAGVTEDINNAFVYDTDDSQWSHILEACDSLRKSDFTLINVTDMEKHKCTLTIPSIPL